MFLGQPLYPDAVECRGRLGHVYIFKQYDNWRVVCPYYYPYNPKTVPQQSHRNIFAYAVAYWQSFDNETKGYYNRLSSPNVMSGYNRFIHFYLEANKSV